jgi:TRAP-type C4-dicarboxylate transport system substrate-binding protein
MSLDEWEQKVLDELDGLKALWEEYARHLWNEAKKLREENKKETIDAAVCIEDFIDHIEMLFIEARAELENEIEDRLQGDTINMEIAARRVNEALGMLRANAKEWKAYVDKLLARGGEGE